MTFLMGRCYQVFGLDSATLLASAVGASCPVVLIKVPSDSVARG